MSIAPTAIVRRIDVLEKRGLDSDVFKTVSTSVLPCFQ
jgi:hypothetical protein